MAISSVDQKRIKDWIKEQGGAADIDMAKYALGIKDTPSSSGSSGKSSTAQAISDKLDDLRSGNGGTNSKPKPNNGGTNSTSQPKQTPTVDVSKYSQMYNNAKANNDYAGMEAANRAANILRGLGDVVTAQVDIDAVKKLAQSKPPKTTTQPTAKEKPSTTPSQPAGFEDYDVFDTQRRATQGFNTYAPDTSAWKRQVSELGTRYAQLWDRYKAGDTTVTTDVLKQALNNYAKAHGAISFTDNVALVDSNMVMKDEFYEGGATKGFMYSGNKDTIQPEQNYYVAPGYNTKSSSNGTNYNYGNSTQSNIQQMIQQLADSQYGQVENSLKKRVANILAQYSSQLGNVEKDYIDDYQNVDQNAYQANEATKVAMAKAGLLNTGIGEGYNQQNAFKYNMARQNVDLQKQGQYDTINNSINETNRNLAYDLDNVALEKANFINQNQLQEAKDLRTIARDDYWRSREADLAERQFDFQKDSFTQQMDFEKEKFDKTMDYNYNNMFEQKQQFLEQMGLQREQLTEQTRQFNEKLKQDAIQFDKNMGFNQDKLTADMEMAKAELQIRAATARMDAGIAQQKLQLEMQEYKDAMTMKLRELNIAQQSFFTEENNRIDGMMFKYVGDTGGLSKESAATLFAVINNSMLTPAMKYEKVKMLNTVLSNGQSGLQFDNPYSQYYQQHIR
jgi:hypothetical protein